MKKYIINADIIRLFAVIGVVFIHVTDPFIVYPPFYGIRDFSWQIIVLINSFFRVSVPLFILLSGYLLIRPDKNIRWSTFYSKRFTRIGIPFVVWTVVYFMLLQASGIPLSPFIIVNAVLSVSLGHLYFLVILMGLYLIAPLFIIYFSKTDKKGELMATGGFIAFTLIISVMNVLVPDARVAFSTNVFTAFIPYISYFLLGYSLRNYKGSNNKSIILILLLIFLWFFTVFFTTGDVGAYHRQYGSPSIMLMSSIMFVLIVTSVRIKLLENKPAVVRFVKNTAGAVFGVYLVHMLVIYLFDYVFSVNPPEIVAPWWGAVLLKFIGVLVVSFVIALIAKRLPLIHFAFGE